MINDNQIRGKIIYLEQKETINKVKEDLKEISKEEMIKDKEIKKNIKKEELFENKNKDEEK